MIVWVVIIVLWNGGQSTIDRDYATEAGCLLARHTMDIRQGAAECKPSLVPGT